MSFRKSILIGCLGALACVAAAVVAHVAVDVQPALAALGQLDWNTVGAMAVVTKYGTGARDPASLRAIEGVYAQATPRVICSQIAITNGDSINSIFHIGNVPSNAIIDPNSSYDYEAVAGVTDFDVGFYYPNGGAVIDLDVLVDGDDISSAGAQTLKGHGTLTTANGMKRAWELAGLTSDPGGELAVVATLKAASTATKVVNFFLRYFKGA